MALTGTRIACTDVVADIVSASGSNGGRAEVLNNAAANSVFLGGAGVTAADGYELKAGKQVSVDLTSGETLKGICGAGLTASVHVLATRG